MNAGNEKKTGLFGSSRIRKISLILMVILVFWFSFMVYKWFGVTDTWGWVNDVVMLIVMFLAVIAAAAVVAWLITFLRTHFEGKQK